MCQIIIVFGALNLLAGPILCEISQNADLSSALAASPSETRPATSSLSVSVVDEKGSSNGGSPTSEDLKNFETFKSSNLYVAPFEDNVLSLPPAQLDFIRSMTKSDIELMRTILREAIEKRNNLISPSVTLMWKYSGRLLGNFIRNRQAEQRLHPRVDPKPSFFTMLAQFIERVLDRGSEIKKEKNYVKKSIQTEELSERADDIFNYISKIIDSSPIGGYLKWNTTTLFKGELSKAKHDLDLLEEVADLTAQFRALGYEGWTFIGRRIVNLLNMFARGIIPSESDVKD